MVASLPGFERPRIIHFESALEYAFLCLMLVRPDVHNIREQPPAISYKPMQRVLKLNFASELEAVAAAVSKSFADRVLLVTDQHIDRAAAAEAARTLAWSRRSLTEVAA
ncbi:hypothetical protein [Paracoccus xiamenensis]|uniref:hypothetical protein n=1 Tax=Paracoccus xiamenensis TaxID=2714901 RepID=UPI00140943E1|nr:hypothetical protein [Paracoccus xiamenensis]NHF74751.1 hypothetical protein [Paracoccus xiamenensis]